MKSVTKYLSCHGLTLITGIILGVVITLACIYRNELLCLLTNYNFWSGLGAMLAGLGTVGLLILGWFKSNDWIEAKRTDVVLKEFQFLLNNAFSYSDKIYEGLEKSKMERLQESNDIEGAINVFDNIERSTKALGSQAFASIEFLLGIFEKKNPALCNELEELNILYSPYFIHYFWGLQRKDVTTLSELTEQAERSREQATKLAMKIRSIIGNHTSTFM